MRVDALPDDAASTPILEWCELLGGKGANQAVGLRQLGNEVALVGVVGLDAAGDAALRQAIADALQVNFVAQRGETALLVDLVDAHGDRRLLESIPAAALIRVADVEAAADLLSAADTVVLQLQQPADALLCAARIAQASSARVVLDGALAGPERDELLRLADVVRADTTEAGILAGHTLRGRQEVALAANQMLAIGVEVVALEVEGEGNLIAWGHGQAFLPHSRNAVRDPTGAGDAFIAGLVTALRRGADPRSAGELAAAAAARTVRHLGGRPDLTGLTRRH